MSLKSILITGTSAGGMGSALAFAFQRQGYLVFATARSPSKIDQELVNLSNVEVLTLDVTSASSIASAVEAVKTQTGGTLDVLLNNSGAGYLMPLVDLDLDAAKAVFEVNLWGLMATTKAFAPLLVKSKGTVVNISSIGGQVVQPFNAIYVASKAAVTMTSETLRLELRPFQVKVLTVIAGGVKTKFQENAGSAKLEPDSFYISIEKEYQEMPSVNSPMPASVFASKIVADVEHGGSGIVYRGALSSALRFLTGWFPTWALDMISFRSSALNKL